MFQWKKCYLLGISLFITCSSLIRFFFKEKQRLVYILQWDLSSNTASTFFMLDYHVYLFILDLRHSTLAADLSTKLSSMTEERDWLNAALANKTEELKRLKQSKSSAASENTCLIDTICFCYRNGNLPYKNFLFF